MFLKVSKDLEVSYVESVENKEELVLVTPNTFQGKGIKFFTKRRLTGEDAQDCNLNLVASLAVSHEGTSPIYGDVIFVRADGSKEHYLNIKQIDYLNDFINVVKNTLNGQDEMQTIAEIKRFLER